MALESKYGRVTAERGDIPDDEPVVLFRAQDRVLPLLLDRYFDLCSEAGSPNSHLEAILRLKEGIVTWQDEHGSWVPDTEPGQVQEL